MACVGWSTSSIWSKWTLLCKKLSSLMSHRVCKRLFCLGSWGNVNCQIHIYSGLRAGTWVTLQGLYENSSNGQSGFKYWITFKQYRIRAYTDHDGPGLTGRTSMADDRHTHTGVFSGKTPGIKYIWGCFIWPRSQEIQRRTWVQISNSRLQWKVWTIDISCF